MLKHRHYTIPVFIPELACPFRCVFCNQFKITGKGTIPDDGKILQTIESHLSSFQPEQRHVEIGFFGGSFTGIPLPQQEHLLALVQPYILSGKISGIRLSTRPDYITDEILGLLGKYRVTTIELGAQSLDDEVLKKSVRGHTAAQTARASEMILSAGFELGLQMMIGLPGDTEEKSMYTGKRIIELGATSTRIYPTLVIRDTILQKWFTGGKYVPLTLADAVHQTKKLLLLFENAHMQILRVGLHPSEGLLNGTELIAGPFHRSFRELILTEI